MASKGKRKQEKALKRRLRKKNNAIPVLDDLGSYFTEFLLRSVYLYSLRHGQESIPQVTARIKELVSEKRFDKLALLLGVDKMPREKAQILAYRAMAAQDPLRARQLMLKALELDLSNMDALMWQTRHDFETSQGDCAEILGRMQAIVDLGARIHGPQVNNMQGRLHEIPIARPYLRALNTLFTTLMDCKQGQEALAVGQQLLSLCPGDMFDIQNRVKALKDRLGMARTDAAEDDVERPVDAPPSGTLSSLDPERAVVLEEISELLKDFCQHRENTDFTALTLKAASLLCQDPSCPVHRGKRASWASGIVYALAQVNGMIGSSGQESFQPVLIHTHFKVSSSTTSKKSTQIKKFLQIGPDNPQWLLDS
ncbi:DUF6398 domain-containing protein [Desulfoplanes formicivorans]|uniref:DUF6398 domain-containing protein n=1 Tax=Desulfoplanes formicivorans TaxID=1592317 RepID=A0A194AJI3_9BACT|nr:DUF6398 domain-containing protein [Desulfoplanes formicivorans]GAU09216.1 hypothetical protein DPF_1937 [Desulfoplanes formicivorans]